MFKLFMELVIILKLLNKPNRLLDVKMNEDNHLNIHKLKIIL